jgi:hypothetical protein
MAQADEMARNRALEALGERLAQVDEGRRTVAHDAPSNRGRSE